MKKNRKPTIFIETVEDLTENREAIIAEILATCKPGMLKKVMTTMLRLVKAEMNDNKEVDTLVWECADLCDAIDHYRIRNENERLQQQISRNCAKALY